MNDVDYTEQFLHTGSSEPVLFETNAPIDKKHFYDFNIFNYTKRDPVLFYILLISGAFLILLSFITFAAHLIRSGICGVLMGIFAILFIFFMSKIIAANSFKSPFTNGNIENYRFYREHFVCSNHFTVSVIPYNIITDAHETEEYFFLYISKNDAHIIPKNSFIISTPQEMRVMLSMNLGNRFTVHCI